MKYRVTVKQWDMSEGIVEADSEEEAGERAFNSLEDFEFIKSNFEVLEIEEIPELKHTCETKEAYANRVGAKPCPACEAEA